MHPALLNMEMAGRPATPPRLRITETLAGSYDPASISRRRSEELVPSFEAAKPLGWKVRPRLLRDEEELEEERRREQERQERAKALMEAVRALEDKRREALLRDELEARARMDAGIFGGLEYAVYIESARNHARLCVGTPFEMYVFVLH